jgi:hypothetical protein
MDDQAAELDREAATVLFFDDFKSGPEPILRNSAQLGSSSLERP